MSSSSRTSARRAAASAVAASPAVPATGLPTPVWIGLGLALALLLAHAFLYWFLTDDAYISFRYARNFAQGHGLVFNPGYERVEGYTNFLWVLMLAGFDKLGIAPERAANPLSLLATAALWMVVVDFVRRRLDRGFEWLVLVPAFALALTRSIAVWSTSGLETRLFELLVIAGLLRLVREVEAVERDESPRSVATWLLALSTLTRPDGLLMALCAFGTATLFLLLRRRERLAGWMLGQLPFVGIVAGHYLFRHAYYGDWLPNTYYAKVGGKSWWSSGGKYLLSFAIEYGAAFWVPLLAGAAVWNARRGTPLLPLLALAVVLPHTLYLAAIGGDHFEYRPMGVLLVLVFLLFADGARELLGGPLRRAGTIALLALTALGLTVIPWESHRQFLTHYRPGFPGCDVKTDPVAQQFLAPERNPLLDLPGIRTLAAKHQELTRWMTFHFVAVRAEEHRMFLATAIEEGKRLRQIKDAGILPADAYIALDCVGAIPYISELRTLDRLGLTDAHVAHSPRVREVMAHGKSATIEYARQRGVDFWSCDPVHLTLPVTSTRLMVAVHDGMLPGEAQNFAVDVGGNSYMVCQLPCGIEATKRRVPGARIMAMRDTSFLNDYLVKARRAWTEKLAASPFDLDAARSLGYILLLAQDGPAAIHHYTVMTQTFPDVLEGFENLALADFAVGRVDEGMKAAEQAMRIAVRDNDVAAEQRIRSRVIEAVRSGGRR